MPCRINTKRKKVARLLLESKSHQDNAFITLTYSDEEVPLGRTEDGIPVQILVPAHLKAFLVRLRTYRNHPYRYYAVGEYGSKTKRPHYHAILFGLSTVELAYKDFLRKTWGLGHVLAGECNVQTMAYVAHYCTKKMTQEDDERLEGRPPEFARMSRMPGLGAHAIDYLMDFYTTRGGALYLAEHGDVGRTFRYNGRVYPMDDYIVNKLREQCGIQRREADRLRVGPSVELTPEYVADWDVKYEGRLEQSKAFHQLEKQRPHGTL